MKLFIISSEYLFIATGCIANKKSTPTLSGSWQKISKNLSSGKFQG